MAIKTYKPGTGPGSSAAEQHIDLPTKQEPTVKEDAVNALDALLEDNQAPQPEPQINVPAEEQPTPTIAPQDQASPQMKQRLEDSKNLKMAIDQKEKERIQPFSERIGLDSIDGFGQLSQDNNDAIGSAIDRADRLTELFHDESFGKAYLGQSKEYYNEFDQTNEEGLTKSEANPNNLGNIILDPKLVDGGLQYQDGAVRVDPLFARVMGLTTLQFVGADSTTKQDVNQPGDELEADVGTARAAGAADLGRQIYNEWKREQNRIIGEPTDNYNPNALSQDQFTVLGSAAKEAFAKANPDLLERKNNATNNQVEFSLTPEGANKIKKMKQQRPDAFINQEIPPSPVPRSKTPNELTGEASKILQRKTTTGIAGQKRAAKTMVQIDRANSIAHVVDPTRRKIFFQLATSALKKLSPVVAQAQKSTYPIDPNMIPPEADLLDIGRDRLQSFMGEQQRLEADPSYQKDVDAGKRPAYVAKEQYTNYILNFIESMNTAAKYSNRPNHLDFGVQLLQNRTHVLQNRFNPQGNTWLRAITGGATPTTWKAGKGSDIDQMFKEVMAVHLIADAKGLLPENRVKRFNEVYFSGGLQNYIDMGKAIEDSLLTPQEDTAMTGIFANAYQGRNQVDLQPAYQSEKPLPANVINEAKKHGKEGPLFIEALKELYKYDQAIKSGQDMTSNIGVEFDGKTHGPATNLTQLGIVKGAYRTGVLRREGATKNLDSFTVGDLLERQGVDSTTEYIAGDLRDAMKNYMLTNGANSANNFAGGNTDVGSVLESILKEAVQDRDNYLKKPPMTLGYGQLLKNLDGAVRLAVYNGPNSMKIQDMISKNRDLLETKTKDNQSADGLVVEFLHDILADSIYNELDPSVISVGQTLRANNLLATLSNEMITIDNAIGSKTYIGANQLQAKEEQGYIDREFGNIPLHESVPAGSAERDGKPGGWGRGRVIPAVIQGIDGAWMNRMFTDSWPQLKKAYMLPIMDAVKTDLKSGAAVRQHANKNWIQANKDFSYVEAIMEEWAPATMQKFKEILVEIPNGSDVQVGPDTNFRGFGWLASSTTSTKGNLYPKNLVDTLYDTMEFKDKPIGQSVADYEGAKKEAAFKKAYEIMTKAGIPQSTNITELTGEQLKGFYNEILKAINLRSRNNQTVAKTKENRRELFTRADKQRTLQVDLG